MSLHATDQAQAIADLTAVGSQRANALFTPAWGCRRTCRKLTATGQPPGAAVRKGEDVRPAWPAEPA